MPLVAPVTGVKQVPWGLLFVLLSEQVGLPFNSRDKGPLLPAPAQVGGWSGRAVSSAEAGRWLRVGAMLVVMECPDIRSRAPHWTGAESMACQTKIRLYWVITP